MWLGWLLALSTWTHRAEAAEVPAVYGQMVDLVGTLYLKPEEATAEAMLHAAGTHLEDRIDWLRVEKKPSGLTLLRGATEELATVWVEGPESLPAALYAIETALLASGYPLGDVDARYATLNGATMALDRYSRVLTGDGLDRFDARLKGTLVGIGARLRFVDDQLQIVGLFGGGPAERLDLHEGDHVVRIDGVPTAAMPINEAVRRIRGEVGTNVTLDIERAATDDEPGTSFTVALARAEVVVPNVVHDVLAGGVGYLRIDSISQKTLVNLTRSITALQRSGAVSNGLVLDLRQNSGGSMRESAAVVDRFVGDGLLLTTAGRDGRPVPQLTDRIEGRLTGDEITAPMVVLVDSATASGAEIIAGALMEQGRAALLGQRTYGKGLVQKIYDLDSSARLKLTVAEYVLANDRHVGGEGLHADVVVGRMSVRDEALRLGSGWNLAREGVPWEAVLPVVSGTAIDEGEAVVGNDPLRELARRAVLSAGDRSRDGVLAALRREAEALRAEEMAALAKALAGRGHDWTGAQAPGGRPEVRVSLTSEPGSAPDSVRWVVKLENHGPTTLYRTMVRTSSAFGPWDGWVVPVGRVAPGTAETATLEVALPRGLPARQDVVSLTVHADQRASVSGGQATLTAPATEGARLAVTARLVEDTGRSVVRVTLRNLTTVLLDDVEAELAWPYDLDVELVERGARTPSLVPGGTTTFDLEVRLGPQVPSSFPLRLHVDAAGHGRILAWELPLQRDGRPVDLAAPDVRFEAPALSATPGPMRVFVEAQDERQITSLVVFHNGQKVAWSPGDARSVSLEPTLELIEGVNVIAVRAVDDEGIATRKTWTLLGLTPVQAL